MSGRGHEDITCPYGQPEARFRDDPGQRAGTSWLWVLGGDPGGVTAGLFIGGWKPGQAKAAAAHAYQCDLGSAGGLLLMLLGSYGGVLSAACFEKWDSRPHGGLRGANAAGLREALQAWIALCGNAGVPVTARPAVTVKGWSTDTRLGAAGVARVTGRNMPHSRDASRYALYSARFDLGIPDPLSRKGTRVQDGQMP